MTDNSAKLPPELPIEDSRPSLRLVHSAEELEVTQPAPLGVPEFKALEPLAPEADSLLGSLQLSPHAQMGASGPVIWDDESDIDAQDNVDPDLFPIFEEEAHAAEEAARDCLMIALGFAVHAADALVEAPDDSRKLCIEIDVGTTEHEIGRSREMRLVGPFWTL